MLQIWGLFAKNRKEPQDYFSVPVTITGELLFKSFSISFKTQSLLMFIKRLATL